jgi:Lon protease-like protein
MYRLPLFPLPVVLFPGAMIPLHIFETRYRRMVAYCLEADKRFGIVFQDPEHHDAFELDDSVGCIAEILDFQPMPDGRSLLLSQGRERFLVRDGIESGGPYTEAVVEEYADLPFERTGLDHERRESVELFYRTLDVLDCPLDAMPSIDRTHDVSFQLAQCIRIDPAWQQTLLVLRSERERLEQLDDLFRAILEDPDQAERFDVGA